MGTSREHEIEVAVVIEAQTVTAKTKDPASAVPWLRALEPGEGAEALGIQFQPESPQFFDKYWET